MKNMSISRSGNEIRIGSAPVVHFDHPIRNPDDTDNAIVVDVDDTIKMMDATIAVVKVGDEVRFSSIPGSEPDPHEDHDVFDNNDNVVFQVLEGESVKSMTDGMLIVRVGNQIRFTAPPHVDHNVVDASNVVLENIDGNDIIRVIDAVVTRSGDIVIITGTGGPHTDHTITDSDLIEVGVVDENDTIELGSGVTGVKVGDIWTFSEASNPLLDSTDSNAGSVAAGQSVKMMSSMMSATLVGTIWQITSTPGSVPVKDSSLTTQESAVAGTDEIVMAADTMEVTRGTAPDDDVLTIDVPTLGQYMDPYMHDYLTVVSHALDYSNVFSQYSSHNYNNGVVRRKQLADMTDPFTLLENNEFGNTSRYVNTNGAPMLRDSSGVNIPDDFTDALNYIIIDTLYDVMYFMGNLGGPLTWTAALDAIAAQNTANFAGYNDWLPLTPNIIERSVVPDKRQDADSGNNLLRKGAAGSGYSVSQERVWTGRSIDQVSGTDAWFFFVDTGSKVPAAKTTSSNHTTYMCRFMSQSDYDALTTP